MNGTWKSFAAPKFLERILAIMKSAATASISQFRRLVALVLSVCLLLGHTAGAIAQTVPDIEPPKVTLEVVESSPADLSQVFTLQASDDIGLGDVSLHYRRNGENAFKRVLMQPIGDTGYFSVAVDTDPNDLREFLYYAQALDLTGNRTVEGFAFDPFIRTITESDVTALTQQTNPAPVATDSPAAAVVVAKTASDTVQPEVNNTRRWIYVALGVLAAGALASQLGGSSGGGESIDPSGNPAVPLTVIIRDPLP